MPTKVAPSSFSRRHQSSSLNTCSSHITPFRLNLTTLLSGIMVECFPSAPPSHRTLELCMPRLALAVATKRACRWSQSQVPGQWIRYMYRSLTNSHCSRRSGLEAAEVWTMLFSRVPAFNEAKSWGASVRDSHMSFMRVQIVLATTTTVAGRSDHESCNLQAHRKL